MKYSFHIKILKLHEHKNDWLYFFPLSPTIHWLPSCNCMWLQYHPSYFKREYHVQTAYGMGMKEFGVSTAIENAIFYHSFLSLSLRHPPYSYPSPLPSLVLTYFCVWYFAQINIASTLENCNINCNQSSTSRIVRFL